MLPTDQSADNAAPKVWQRPGKGTRTAYRIIDTAVVWFAGWTVLYHAGLLIGGPLASAAVLAVAGAALAAVLVAGALHGRRNATWDLAAGPVREPGIPPPVVLTALAAAALSLIANRPDADDVFYVNRSSAVSALGAVPTRDTMFSDQVFAMSPGQYPPVASFEALVGCIARAAGTTTEFATYFVLPPLGSVLAVLALWRLLACWQVRWPLPAFAVAVTYLAWGGQFHASFGNTWVERMWQGKIFFISALVPTLLVYIIKAAGSGRWADRLLVWCAAVAGIGLTSAGIYVLGGFFAVAGLTALLLRHRTASWLGLLAPAGYTLAMALIWQAANARNSADVMSAEPLHSVISRASIAFTAPGDAAWGPGADIVTRVLGTGPYLVIGLLAAVLGWSAVRHPFARLMALLTVVMLAVLLSPLGIGLMDLVELPESIRWRVMWLLPVPALLGALVAGAAARLGRLGLAAVVGSVLLIVSAGLPIWSPANGVTLGAPVAKWPSEARQGYSELLPVLQDGDVVGADENVGGMLTSLSGSAWGVNPRTSYTTGMSAQGGFCSDQRIVVAGYARGEREFGPEVLAALQEVGVTVLRLDRDPGADLEPLADLGFQQVGPPGLMRRDAAVAEQAVLAAGECRAVS